MHALVCPSYSTAPEGPANAKMDEQIRNGLDRRRAIDTKPICKLGNNALVDDGVVHGYRYPGDSRPLVIGDHAVIRSGTIVYANTTIGHRFQCGRHVLIRAEVTIGNLPELLLSQTGLLGTRSDDSWRDEETL